jgi:hypothetical protein
MATLIFDTITGSQLEAERTFKRQSRTGTILDLNVVGAADSTVLNKAYDLVVASVPFGTQHPSNNATYFTRLVINPAGPGVSDSVRFEMIYDSNQFPVATAYMLRDGSTMTAYNSRFLPGTDRHKRIIANSWTDPVTGRVVKPNSINHQFLRPIRTVSVNALIYGHPPDNIRDLMGKVNNAPWMGLPIAYWLVMAIESDFARQQGYYTYSATVMTKGNEDWSDIDVLEDPLTGLPVAITESEVQAALTAAYAYGNHPGNGFTRVCGYETANLAAVLGFSSRSEDPNWDISKYLFVPVPKF